MAFKFRLQKILDLKEKQEDSKKNEVAKVLRQISDEKNILEEHKGDRKVQLMKREDLNSEGCSVNEILDINIYIKYIDTKIEESVNNIKELEILLKQKQDEYIEVRKERKSYDKLKEKHLERYNQEEAKKEEKIIDGIVTYANRKRG